MSTKAVAVRFASVYPIFALEHLRLAVLWTQLGLVCEPIYICIVCVLLRMVVIRAWLVFWRGEGGKVEN